MKRREFLKLGLGSSLFVAGCRCPFCKSQKPVALQLWSIHKIMWKEDPAKTFAALKEIGFDGVEFAGYGGRSAKDIRKLLQDAGLRGMGTHVGGDQQYTGDNLKKNLDFCAEAGIESITNPWSNYDNADGWKKFGELMGKAADTAKAWNLPVSVHNHEQEFTKKYDGVFAWDLIFQNASKSLNQQIDTCQVIRPGQDPVEWLKKYPGQNFSVHMKERTPSEWGYMGLPTKDGKKLVDWPGVIAYLDTDPSNKWYVIECEMRPDSLKPARYNYNFLKKLI